MDKREYIFKLIEEGYSDEEAELKANSIYDSKLKDGTKYDKQAAKIISDSGLFDEETSQKIIDALYKEKIHAFVHAPNWLEKYLKGIARMLVQYSNGNKERSHDFLEECPSIFDKYLTLIKSQRDKLDENTRLKLDNKFVNEMSYQDVKNELEKRQEELDKISKEELSKMKFSGSNYELVPINSYEEMNSRYGGALTGDGGSDKYAGGGGTAWCHTNSQGVYNAWTGNKNRFFVLENKNFKNIKFDPVSNKENPKDEYGNSLIAILVNKKGNLLKATLRCNHVGVDNNADNQYVTYSELSKVAGFNVEEEIKKYIDVDKDDINNIFDITNDGKLILNHNYEDDITGEIIIPNELHGIKVTSIGDYAFEYCRDLTSITIPDSVTSIGYHAFSACTELKTIKIPNSVTSIGNYAFYDCESLTSIVIPNSVTSIGDYAFEFCTELKTITIPNSVKYIGLAAFYNCAELTSIVIPNSVTSIGEAAFKCCESLTNITIPNSIINIGKDTFYGCESLTSITIPNSVTIIGEQAFADCTELTSIVIPNSVTSIGEAAFKCCESLIVKTNNQYVINYCKEIEINYETNLTTDSKKYIFKKLEE